MPAILDLQNISHSYTDHVVLSLPQFSAVQGEHTLVLGMSGSGKSTLLHIMAGLLRPKKGTVRVGNTDLYGLKGQQLDQYRGAHIGIVFQQMHLLPALTIEENIGLALYLAGKTQDQKRIRDVLSSLDLSDKMNVHPHQLSQGQKQRACIARAVINQPALILADEPTASLDDVRCQQVLDLLIEQAESCEATLVIATHDQRIKPYFSNQIMLSENTPMNLRSKEVEES